ncbi:MAG: Cytochrome c class I [Methylococcaceae bacterium NSP1-2]|nr:cytochrome c4 [Methylococcaceae bacterium]OYV20297.1 MAG: Cytochrome c class I [Methylococcaceae bacterium NSP1-2]
MKKKWLALSLTLAFASTSSLLYADTDADIEAGETKAASCVSCHGENGNSMVSTFPKLAQQDESYLRKQLHAFKNGSRKNPMMASIAQSLSDKDIIDIAAYYMAQKVSVNELPVMNDDDDDDKPAVSEADKKIAMDKLLAQGGDLYRNGDLPHEVSACIACHGPLAEGNEPAAFPALRSQHADYLIKTLTDFKNGERSNNAENMMHMITKKMTVEEIKAVSYRISMMK